MIKFLDLYSQYLSIKPEIDAAIERVIRNSAFIGGEELSGFERAFADYQEASYCVGVGNGTDAIEIILEAASLPRGGEVIVPANSFIASSEAVSRSGLKVVFADVCSQTYTLDPEDVKRKINANTCALIAVHLYGQPCAMDELLALAKEHGLFVLEDCAQAHGALYKGRKIGALGNAGSFSFYPGKNLGAYGDGGAITTNDAALAKRCRMIANHGRIDKYNHEFEGRNSRLDGLQAAILSVKLSRLESWIVRRNELAAIYRNGLEGIGDLVVPIERLDCRHAYHLFVIRSTRRDELGEYLRGKGVQTGVHYPIALPCLPAYAGYEAPSIACGMAKDLLSLPIGEHMSATDIAQIVELVGDFFANR